MLEHIRAIGRLLADEWKKYAAALLALIVASFFLYIVPLIPQAVIDGVLLPTGKKTSGLTQSLVSWMGGREWLSSHLWFPALLLVALTVIAGVFTYLRKALSAEAGESLTRKLRDRVYDHMQHLPTSYFDDAETGDLIQRCTSDVETLRLFLTNQITEIGRALILLLLPLPLMWWMSPWMTLASVCLLPVIVGFSWVFFRKVREIFKHTDEAEGVMTANIQENITGIRVVRAFSRQQFECEKFEENNRTHRDLDYRLYVLMAHFWGLSDLLCFAQRGLVLLAGIALIHAGQLGVGAFFFFITAVNMFLWPMRMMGRLLAELGKAMVSLGRISEILEVEPEVQGGERPDPSAAAHEVAFAFEDVSFGYGDAQPAVEGLSFSMKAGQTLALVGPSGSGKSTILRLLMRLYAPDCGKIELAGQELQSWPLKAARSQMSAVMQWPFLYSRSIFENLRIARPDASREEVIEAAKLACVHQSILAFEDGYETVIGERGVTLSGGQRQRIALARALLQNADILLLDDAMSAVDTETESAILSGLRSRRSTVLVSHRLSSVMHADQILVLDQGRIVQAGTHQELLGRQGWYRQLWDLQRSVESDVPEVFHSAAA